jgi:hypothetical protein
MAWHGLGFGEEKLGVLSESGQLRDLKPSESETLKVVGCEVVGPPLSIHQVGSL